MAWSCLAPWASASNYRATNSSSAPLTCAHHNVAMESLARQFEILSLMLRNDESDPIFCLIMIDARGRVDFATGPLLHQIEANFGSVVAGALAAARLVEILTASASRSGC